MVEENEDNTVTPKSLGTIFRNKLLERCRDEFSIDRVKLLRDIQAMDIPEVEKTTLKKRYTGHMRFFGEMFLKVRIFYK